MARADASIGLIEAGAHIGYEPQDESYSAQFGVSADTAKAFGKGTVGRRMVYIWAGATIWLLLVWRAVDGY